MLTIRNHYDDRDVIISARDTTTGQDGESVAVEAGRGAEIEIGEGQQVVVSTILLAPGQERQTVLPKATLTEDPTEGLGQQGAEDDSQKQPDPAADAATKAKPSKAPTLTDAGDDDVRATMAEVTAAEGDAVPSLDPLNAALAAKGFNPVDATRRDALLQPA